MKKSNLLAIGLAGAFLLTSGVTAFAADAKVVGQVGKTETNVTIIDAGDDEDHKLEPTDPTQTHLLLKEAPSGYNFETSVNSSVNYVLESKHLKKDNGEALKQKFVVFNDKSKRNWEVRATVSQLVDTKDSKKAYDVSTFTINKTVLTGTGESAVFKNADNSIETNTNDIPYPVTSVAMTFQDTNHQLKPEDKLKGTISYQLYCTSMP